MAIRTATAEWQGDLPSGSGTFSGESAQIEGDYSFQRFDDGGGGTNPEELIAAAHAGCFSMQFSAMLAAGGNTPESIRTEAKVQVINTRKGEIVDSFESGDTPHENNFSENGKRIFHASIGTVYTPLDQPAFDTTKGKRFFQIVDARTMEVRRRLNMGKILDEAGFPDMSAAVRPMTLSPNERYLYFQVSFFHGYIEYDLRTDRVRRVVTLPQGEEAKDTPREEYLLDSAHHGIAMNPQGTKLCVAGTMSDYAAVVNRRTTRYRTIPVGEKPYWSTTSEDGRFCFVSVSGEDRVSVISMKKAKEVASIPVGNHPQRMRTGHVRRAFVR